MKNIIYCCQFTDASGYASAARKYLYMLDRLLDKNEYNLKIYNSSFESKINCSVEDLNLLKKYELKNSDVKSFVDNNKYTAIFHLLPHSAFLEVSDKYLNKKIYEKAHSKINIFYWEADRIPEMWRQIFSQNLYNKVIAGCEWNKEIFLKDVNCPIEIIHIPLKEKTLIRNKKENFNILSLSQWQPRKGFDILIKSFYQEFFNTEDAILTIKTYRDEASVGLDTEIVRSEALAYKSSCTDYVKDPKCKINIITGILSKEKLEEIYASSDVFCLASRGEGFSIPSAEAALYGIPCIIPKIGGHIDFLDKSNNFFFDCYYKPVESMGKGILYSSCEMNFLEPDILSVRKQLRAAYEIWKKNPERLDQMGKTSKIFTSEFLSEEKIFKKFMEFVC